MKSLVSGFFVVALAVLLSGCYYDPGYSYVRATPYAGAVYYGSGGGYYADPGWYDPGWYDPGWYGYGGWYGGYGCCYASGVVVGGVWYDRWGHRHHRGGGYPYRGGSYMHRGSGYLRGPGSGHSFGGGHGHWSGHAGAHRP